MSLSLNDYQKEAIHQMKNGSVLCGGVGSGKSRTAIAYYIFKVCQGSIKVKGPTYNKGFSPMMYPRDLYIITTAKKRDSLEWEKELSKCCINILDKENIFGVKIIIDSWNNIKKYRNVFGSFFIFDEQRVVGKGAWVKSFLDIARKNKWILLSATPGDTWSDYIPVFIANGFYKNRTDFTNQHCIYSRYSKYPKIEGYMGEKILRNYRDKILVKMKDDRLTVRKEIQKLSDYDLIKYRAVFRDHWDPYENCPIEESGKWLYLLRKVVNSDLSRLDIVKEIMKDRNKIIIFYNFTYELDILKKFFDSISYPYSEWNGKKHQEILNGERWVYLVQYAAGCEGWNCITTDTIIFYSQNYSYRMTEQACGRIDRINTPYRILYYYYIYSNSSIDLAIKRSLKNKKNFNEKSFCGGFQ